MRPRPPYIAMVMYIAVAACSGGTGGIGDSCSSHGDCAPDLQCITDVCVPRCQGAPQCGDGYACTDDGRCIAAEGRAGDSCRSEAECAAGLSCQIDGAATDETNQLLASCTEANRGRPAGSTCFSDVECTNGTCALGHCVDLCTSTRDCGVGTQCTTIPRVEADGAQFQGCLPLHQSLVWSIPVLSPTAEIMLPIPGSARSAQLTFSVDDPTQQVGAQTVIAPGGTVLYEKPCEPLVCGETTATAQYFGKWLRHLPLPGQSTLQIPAGSHSRLEPGPYRLRVSSFRGNGAPGSAIPRVTAVVKMDSSNTLDLHFYFLDLEDHPCQTAFGGTTLDATVAKNASFFQTDFLGELGTIFRHGGIQPGNSTFEDIKDHADLDGLSIDNVGSLLSLGSHADGINVFFVRTLSPVGLQAYAPNPGPARLPNTRQSGIIIGVDTLCYRSWTDLARLTAHEIARYMGLYHNVELDPQYGDDIDDTFPADASQNLLFFSELGGTTLTPGQSEILTRSAVLR